MQVLGGEKAVSLLIQPWPKLVELAQVLTRIPFALLVCPLGRGTITAIVACPNFFREILHLSTKAPSI